MSKRDKKDKKIIKFEQKSKFISYRGRTYRVVGDIGESDDMDFYIDGKAYVNKDNNTVYICSKNSAPIHKDVPIVFVKSNEDGKPVFTLQDYEGVGVDVFKTKSINDLDLNVIIDEISGDEELYNDEMINDMNSSYNTFKPIINESDDNLKKIIKRLFYDKEIELSRIKYMIPNKYMLTNIRTALVKDTKMSISYFNTWCELIGVDYDIIIRDRNNGHFRPLEKPLVFKSSTGSFVEEDVDDDELDEE